MSTIPSGLAPEPKETFVYESSPLPRWIYAALIALLLLVGYLFYAGYTDQDKLQTSLTAATNQEAVLAAEIDQSNSRVAELRAKLEVTSQKLGLTQDELARASTLAETIKQQQKDSDAQLAAQIGQVQQSSDQKIGAVSTDLSGTKSDLSATKEDLAATKAQLSTAVGDLGVQSGLIAHNEGEVRSPWWPTTARPRKKTRPRKSRCSSTSRAQTNRTKSWSSTSPRTTSPVIFRRRKKARWRRRRPLLPKHFIRRAQSNCLSA
jgi:hypothetical protein